MQLLPSIGMALPPQIEPPRSRIVTAVVVSTWAHLSSAVEVGSFTIRLNTIDRSIDRSINQSINQLVRKYPINMNWTIHATFTLINPLSKNQNKRF